LCSTRPDWDIDLLEFTVIRNAPVSAAELALIPQFPSFGTFGGASFDAEGEWRWRHDQEALKQEYVLNAAAQRTKIQEEQTLYETRLKHLGWDLLLAEAMFERWSPCPPFPPAAFVASVRGQFRNAINELRNIRPWPSKTEARRILKTLVSEINTLDESYQNVVETEEREDLCAKLAEIAFVAKHPDLKDEIDAWRAW
jgi:hypothetical protein